MLYENIKSNKIEMENMTLLITGCINPYENQVWLKLKDKQERLKQYVDSIIYYINTTNLKKIVFCENSNYCYDADSIKKIAANKGKEFEWISFKGNISLVKKYDKGAGESEIIDYALCHSKLLKDSAKLIKVTGRLKLTNISNLLQAIKLENNYFVCDIYRSNPHAVDTRFYVVDMDLYKTQLSHYYDRVQCENPKIEECYFILLNGKFKSFVAYPRFVGISGGNGRDYSKEFKPKLLLFDFLCKTQLFNVLFPFVHFFNRGISRLIRIKS